MKMVTQIRDYHHAVEKRERKISSEMFVCVCVRDKELLNQARSELKQTMHTATFVTGNKTSRLSAHEKHATFYKLLGNLQFPICK